MCSYLFPIDEGPRALDIGHNVHYDVSVRMGKCLPADGLDIFFNMQRESANQKVFSPTIRSLGPSSSLL